MREYFPSYSMIKFLLGYEPSHSYLFNILSNYSTQCYYCSFCSAFGVNKGHWVISYNFICQISSLKKRNITSLGVVVVFQSAFHECSYCACLGMTHNFCSLLYTEANLSLGWQVHCVLTLRYHPNLNPQPWKLLKNFIAVMLFIWFSAYRMRHMK